jgi:predicted amidohydrolase YtcJ
MRRMIGRYLASALIVLAASAALRLGGAGPLRQAQGRSPADTIYRHGRIYTADANDRFVEAVAVQGGRIVYAGTDAGAAAFSGGSTRIVDLAGGFAMPGLVDGHMHPLEGGLYQIRCSLKYESLTVAEFRRRIQACLDADRRREPDGWLQVVGWFQQSMQPAGTTADRAMLDSLDTRRPILVRDAFGHTVLANSRALALARITRETPDPAGGKIERDAGGEPTGLLQDAASAAYEKILPPPTPEERVAAVRAALKVMASQGITTALDAVAAETAMEAFRSVERAGDLTARMHFAPLVELDDARDPAGAVARITRLRSIYDAGGLVPAPGLTVRNAKFFMDGVIAGPAFTGSMLEPYRVNAGTPDAPNWIPGASRGPDPYFAPAALADLLVRLGRAGIDPHLHADGDRAVRAALDGIAAMRQALGRVDVRPAIAHAEIVHADDYGRFKALNVFAVLSTQWGKPAPDTVDQLRDYLGPDRAAILEPSGLLAAAGAPLAYGSDWPVDALDEWFALKVAVTRENAPEAGPRYAGRLGRDPGLTRIQALRAITIGAARSLHCDDVAGSIEPGKLADLAILDRDPFAVPAADIARVQVKETIVGGRTVHRRD